METIDVDRFYSAGYMVIPSSHPGWPQLHEDGINGKLISLSDCISPRLLKRLWTDITEQEAPDYGIRPDRLDAFVHWRMRAYPSEIDDWGTFISLQAAHHFVKEFAAASDYLHIIGVGIASDLAESHFPNTLPFSTVERQIAKRMPLERGGTPIGFEVVSYGYAPFGHSWLCSGLHRELRQALHTEANAYGLIPNENAARRLYEWIAEDEMRGHRAEPEPYHYWLLVDYPFEATKDGE